MRKMIRASLWIGLAAIITFIMMGNGAFEVLAEEQGPVIRTDTDIAGELGLLLGDGNGLTAQYLEKSSTRMQAAIISLRLKGKLQEALEHTGTTSFTDKDKVSGQNQSILAYLKNHPELGWQGKENGAFDPQAAISSQQLYKVLLETLGYMSGTDFDYAETESFAVEKGLSQITGTKRLTNAHIATALVESLPIATSEGQTLFAQLQAEGVLPAAAKLPGGNRLSIGTNKELGNYFTDENGRTLYFFTKDAENPNACQGDCLKNWPVYYEDELILPAFVDRDDFDVLERTDGTKQLTYKGWPLYYFVKDVAKGDVFGEAVNSVWFVAKPDYAVMIGTSTELGHYLTDDYGNTLYYFDKDTPDKSVCEGQCIVNWPTYAASEKNSVPSTLKSEDISAITRVDGSSQATFKGYPLYYFVKDGNRGETTGQNVNKVWFVINPSVFEGSTAAQVKTYYIDIKEFSFGLAPLKVEAGSKIVFTNYDDMQHNAVAVDGSFSTPLLDKGQSFEITISEAGTYEYFCEPHKQFMTGTIIAE